VIVGAFNFAAPTFIARNTELQQNADTPLSCHHSNNDLETIVVEPKFLPYPIREHGTKTLRELHGVLGLSFAPFSAELSPQPPAAFASRKGAPENPLQDSAAGPPRAYVADSTGDRQKPAL
jgi:hypothetical protein